MKTRQFKIIAVMSVPSWLVASVSFCTFFVPELSKEVCVLEDHMGEYTDLTSLCKACSCWVLL